MSTWSSSPNVRLTLENSIGTPIYCEFFHECLNENGDQVYEPTSEEVRNPGIEGMTRTDYGHMIANTGYLGHDQWKARVSFKTTEIDKGWIVHNITLQAATSDKQIGFTVRVEKGKVTIDIDTPDSPVQNIIRRVPSTVEATT